MNENEGYDLPWPEVPPIPTVPPMNLISAAMRAVPGPLLATDAQLRDEMACFALMGLLAWSPSETDHQYKPSDAASLAYRYADAMMVARNLPPGDKP